MSDAVVNPCDLILPVWNERENLAGLLAEVRILQTQGVVHRAIFVDDGSTDGTPEFLTQVAQTADVRGDDLVVLSLPNHRGKTHALRAGLELCQAEFVVQADGDGQAPLAEIARLLSHFGPGIGAVIGKRVLRKDGVAKRLYSRVGNRLGQWAFGYALGDVNSCLRVFRRKQLLTLPSYEGNHRYLPYYILAQGWQVLEVPIPHRPRTYGKSKYGYWQRTRENLSGVWKCRKQLAALGRGLACDAF